MYLHSFILSCRRPFAEGRVTVGGHSYPPDFGGANFSVPWTTRKADFAADLNFFTASLRGGENGFRELKVGGKISKPREHVTRDLERLLYL